MKCPNCGIDAGSSPFCPQCGADLSAHRRRRRTVYFALDRRIRHFASAIVILIAAMSVITVAISAMPVHEDQSPPQDPSIPDGAVAIGDGYVEFSDSYLSGFSPSVNYRGDLVSSIDPSDLEGVTRVVWVKIVEADGSAIYLTKDVSDGASPEDIGWLAWEASSPGTYIITAYCYSEDGTLLNAFSGSFTYLCDVERTYEWSHGGRMLSFTYTVSLSDRLAATSSAVKRTDGGIDSASRFVSATGAAADLESDVWNAYSSILGGARQSADYAACIVEFVAANFTEADDFLTYGTEVYWAFPAETIYAGQGDSGDLCVLAASLLMASGNQACLAKMPGEWFVGLPVLSVTPIDGTASITSDSGLGLTSISPFYGVGLVSDVYGCSDGVFFFRGEAVGVGYGVVELVRSSDSSSSINIGPL